MTTLYDLLDEPVPKTTMDDLLEMPVPETTISDLLDMPVPGTSFINIPTFDVPAHQAIGRIMETSRGIAEDVRLGEMPELPPPMAPGLFDMLPGIGAALGKPIPFETSKQRYAQELKAAKKRGEDLRPVTVAHIQEKAGEVQRAFQSPHTARAFREQAEDLKGKFLAKTYRRWERGSAMVVGGGLHLAEELTRVATLGEYGDTPAEWARMYHNTLKQPEMQAVVENTFDKYFGGAVETGPFMATALAPAALTGGATLPSSVAGFLTAYAVEGNNAYQTSLDRGNSETESRLRGIATGIINGGIEVVGGSGGKYFKNKKALTKAVGTKLAKAKTFSRNVLRNALKEGLMEELPQEAVSMIVGGDVPRKPDGSIDYDATVDRLTDAAVMGTILGGAIDAPITLVNIHQGVKQLEAIEARKSQPNPIKDQGTEVVSPIKKSWTKKEIDSTFGPGINDALKAVRSGEMSVDELTDLSESEAPRTAVVTELAKLVDSGLSIDEAVQTLQDIRTPKAVEVTHKKQVKAEVAEIIDSLTDVNPEAFNKKVIGARKSRTQEFLKSVWDTVKHYHWGHIRIGRMLEFLDNKTDGPLTNYIWKPLRAAVTKSTLGRAFRAKQITNKLEELNLDINSLYGTRIQIREGLSFTANDILEIFLATKDEAKLVNLKEGNNLSDADINAALNVINNNESLSELGHWLLEQYSADFDEVSEKYLQTTGKALEKIGGYSAIRRVPESRFTRFLNVEQEFDDLLHQEILGEVTPSKRGVKQDMVKARTKAIGPLNLDALGNYLAHSRAVEHYKAMVVPVYNINRMISDKDFRVIVNAKTNGAGNAILQKWLRDVASESTSIENTAVSRILGTLRRNAVVSALGLNIVTALKQPISLSLAMAENPRMIPAVMKNFMAKTANWSRFKDFVNDNSKVVPYRNMEREMRELARKRSVKKQILGKRRISELSLGFIRFMDQTTVQVVWKSAYDVAMTQGKSETQAIAYADSVVEKTQPMADIMDLPHLFRGGELHKMLTVFQNQINQNYNYWAHDILGLSKRQKISKTELTYRVLMSTILPATILGLVSSGGTIPDDPKKFAKDLTSFMIAPLFLFGKIASSIINGYDPSSILGFGAAKEFYRASRAKDTKKKAKHIFGGGAKLVGLPWSQPARTGKGIMSEAWKDDPRRLIWSKSALEKGTTPTGGGRRLRRTRGTRGRGR
jgi:hypothetical protein